MIVTVTPPHYNCDVCHKPTAAEYEYTGPLTDWPVYCCPEHARIVDEDASHWVRLEVE